MNSKNNRNSFFRRDDDKAPVKNSENRNFTSKNKPSRPILQKDARKASHAPPTNYSEGDRLPRALRGKKAEEVFSRQVFEGESKTYSDRLNAERTKRKEAQKPASKRKVDPNAPLRLNRFIAQSGVCSRREADGIILSGEVTVNGKVVVELGTKVMLSDNIEYQGKRLQGEKKIYILMNKPKGCITSLDDPHNSRTVMDLLKGEVKERVYPVGRLDKNTTGVLLITNDGDLTKELTHPSFEKQKIYHVVLDRAIHRDDLAKLAENIELEDGPIHADEVAMVGGTTNEVGVEIHSGRNRIVRRMFEHLGYDVERLDRVYFAGLTKSALRRGFWRHLTDIEVQKLKSNRYR